MSGKKGASGRVAKSGEAVRLYLFLDSDLVSQEAVDFIKKLDNETNPTQRALMLDQALKAGLEVKEKAGQNLKSKALAMLKRKSS